MSKIVMTIAIPVMGKINETKGCWGALVANTTWKKDYVELLVINNNSQDDTVEFLEKFVFPHFPNHKLINNQDNVGMIASLDQCYKASSGDIIAMLHNDLMILEHKWDERVVNNFDLNPRLGLAGFFGAKGAATNGGRFDCYSNFLEAEYHGIRNTGSTQVVLFDGISLIARREMLDEIGGIDKGYTYHHFYDKDLSLMSHTSGWENWMIGVYCHHLSGQTANSSDYQAWISKRMGVEEGKGDNESYLKSEAYYLQKWFSKLPIKVP